MSKQIPRSLRTRLSIWLAGQTFFVLGVVCVVVYVVANVNLERRQDELLEQKREVVRHVVEEQQVYGLRNEALQASLSDMFSDASNFLMTLQVGNRTMDFGYPRALLPEGGRHLKTLSFQLPLENASDGVMLVRLSMDVSSDIALRVALAWTLFACALGGAIAVSACGALLVGRIIRPMDDLGRQAARISPYRIGQRLDGAGQARELQPLIGQFNAVLERLEAAYVQMESFNADVAHELRTPLATMMGNTEYALSGTRDASLLRDTLSSNLEDVQRMAGIVNDMLFLSRADRGAEVRGEPLGSVAEAVSEVVQYHEAEALNADVEVRVTGDACVVADRSLLQRAISNLLSNAIRYADRHSVVEIAIIDGPAPVVQVVNAGRDLLPEHLERMFNRFYRADVSRASQGDHYGLGLSIVAAIARMHRGSTFARSEGGWTTVGLTLGAPLVAEG